MKVMGHRDVKTAMKYQHREIDIVRAVLNQGDVAKQALAGRKKSTAHFTAHPEKPQPGK